MPDTRAELADKRPRLSNAKPRLALRLLDPEVTAVPVAHDDRVRAVAELASAGRVVGPPEAVVDLERLAVDRGLGGLLAVQENQIRGLAAIFDQLEDAYAAVTAAAYDTVRQEYAPRFDQKAQEPPPPTAEQPSSPVPPSASPVPDNAETDAGSLTGATPPHAPRPETETEENQVAGESGA